MPVEALSSTVQYSEHVNPQWVNLLDLLEMNVEYRQCSGAELITSDGRCILDFLSGYCVHNVGHNHPAVIAALKDELDRSGPAMLQSHVPESAGQLAAKLCRLAGGRLSKVFFASSGSEGIEAAIKFARVFTGRTGLLYADGAFHGLTCGALSLMGNRFWREGFGPMLPQAEEIPFGGLDALETKLKSRKFAALILEPVQAEGGIRIPQPEYLQGAQRLCRKHGTVFVLDEVQTGMFRTGPFLAAHHYALEPDITVLAKALSGGLVPIASVLMSDEIYHSVYSSLKRAIVHTSTFSENALAMRAGLATLEVLEQEKLGARAAEMGIWLRQRLQEELSGFAMISQIRGIGMLSGIEFRAPSKLGLRIAFESFQKIHPAMFGQMVVMRMFKDENILTQICGNNFMVLKVSPPLGIKQEQLEQFVGAARRVVELIHSSSTFWSDALGLARRALNI
jgi:ornithine--oxo-acid transaminase